MAALGSFQERRHQFWKHYFTTLPRRDSSHFSQPRSLSACCFERLAPRLLSASRSGSALSGDTVERSRGLLRAPISSRQVQASVLRFHVMNTPSFFEGDNLWESHFKQNKITIRILTPKQVLSSLLSHWFRQQKGGQWVLCQWGFLVLSAEREIPVSYSANFTFFLIKKKWELYLINQIKLVLILDFYFCSIYRKMLRVYYAIVRFAYWLSQWMKWLCNKFITKRPDLISAPKNN